jgi:predicted nucleotidyltransferase
MAPGVPANLENVIDRTRLAEAARRFRLDLIVLFGSHARAEARPDSDMDIAVRTRVPPRQRDGEWHSGLGSALSRAIDADVDWSLLNDVSTLLMTEVAADGIPLYECEPGEFLLFKAYAWVKDADEYKIYLCEDAFLSGDFKKVLEWV